MERLPGGFGYRKTARIIGAHTGSGNGVLAATGARRGQESGPK